MKYSITKYGERLEITPEAQTQVYPTLSGDFLKLSAKKQAILYLEAYKIILANPCKVKDAEVMFAIYSDEPHGNKVAKLLDKAGMDRFNESEKGVGVKEIGPNDKERTAHWFHFDIPHLEVPHKHEKRVKTIMEKLFSIGGWGDYNFQMTEMKNADLTVGGLCAADKQRDKTANIWFDLNGITIAEFKIDETASKTPLKGMRDLLVYKPKKLKKIAKGVLERGYLTQEEQHKNQATKKPKA